MYYRLQLAEHDGRRLSSVRLARDANLRVGAHPDCDLVLTGREVLRFISRFLRRHVIRLIDLGSASGVWFDDERHIRKPSIERPIVV